MAIAVDAGVDLASDQWPLAVGVRAWLAMIRVQTVSVSIPSRCRFHGECRRLSKGTLVGRARNTRKM